MRTLSKPIGTILVLLSIFSFSRPAEAKYGGGSGTADDPYQIATAADLIALGDSPEDYDKHFILTDNIDLDPNLSGGKVFDKAVIAPGVYVWEQGGFVGTPFAGILDGGGHRISHLTVKGVGYLGLIGQLQSGAEVRDLSIVDVNISGSGYYVAGLVGDNRGAVTQCYSTGTVSGQYQVGGLVGYNNGAVANSWTTGLVIGTFPWSKHVGGLVGGNGRTVTRCYSSGVVSGTEYIGGLVGDNWGTVTECYSTGAVNGSDFVGGMVGSNYSGDVTSSYSNGRVTGKNFVGGLAGYNYDGSITTSYSTGAVSGSNFVGGLVQTAWPGGYVTASFWDVQASGQATSDGGTGLTTAQMQTASTFLIWGTCENEGIWTIDEGKDYPRLRWENKPGEVIQPIRLSDFLTGTGTEDDPYMIYTAQDISLMALVVCDLDKQFKVMADIDMSGFDGKEGRPGFNTIASDLDTVKSGFQGTPFTGVFDGNGHKISHLTINGSGYLGLFGQMSGEVKDLGVVDVNIIGAGAYVGGLAGMNFGGVTQCYSTGAVSGSDFVGGLVGYNRGSATDCYSTGAVSGTSSVGGLVGYSNGAIDNCYSLASTNGDNYVGGLAGRSYGRVTNCYSVGRVTGTTYVGGLVGANPGAVRASFWDIQTSGQGTSAGGTGLTTAEMQTASTFFNWGFCEGAGVWTVDDGHDYPRLSCEHKPGLLIQSHLYDFLKGSGTPEDPYLIYTLADVNTIANFPCEQGKHFRLMFLTGEGTQESPYLLHSADEINLLNLCPYGRDAHFRLMFVEGEGSRDSPYLINRADELNLVGMCPYERDAHFKLMADIDLSAFDGKDARPAFTMLGSSYDHAFTGVFDGGGHSISNFNCTAMYSCGPFRCVSTSGLLGYVSGPNSVIRNVQLTWPNIDAGSGGVVGALVGSLENGTVTDCRVEGGSVSGGWQVGGLVGTNYQGTITGCNSTATVSGNGSVGGLVGSNYGTITGCDAAGRVLGDYDVGGLVGENGSSPWGDEYQPGAIYDCYSTAGVLGTGSNCGGLVGSNEAGEVVRCYASGIVLGVNTVGGLAGWNGGYISNCYSATDVGGEKDVGGLVGLNSWGWLWSPKGTIAKCYSTGIVLGDEYIGGLVGEADANDVVASFWDIGTSGQEMSAGGTGKTTAEMKTPGTFLEAGLPAAVGWDFVGETANGTEDIWTICEGVDYPHLAWEFAIGDFDADADTDFADFCILAEHWLAADGSFWCGGGCDLTNDGSVNWKDLMVLAENWLTSRGP